ncbi:hypothetical protein BDV24DRAFT_176109 [Aspergillus arachidicola]|uniref:Uncharacterized protein n=1 Tax=Aspergillus arachidicola TaxID=656916 RepID=A0A5N6Y4U9_9EURO|nr:hypothetical protein BDV24DRAFT_176109 [Aspergillus arachidicola]
MSLITDGVLKCLWEGAQAQASNEWASAKFEYYGGDSKLAVLAFHEANPLYAGPQDVQDAERQAFDTYMKYLGEHPGLQFVYSFTVFGTKDRAWRCTREDVYLSPLFGSDDLAERTQYVELHTSDAQLIRQAVQMMKKAVPQYE